MSSDSKTTHPNIGSISQPQGENFDGVRALEQALAGINATLGREGEEMSEQDLVKVLKQLEAAEGVADDVEGKLDELLKNLGGMLEGLETGKDDERGASAEKKP